METKKSYAHAAILTILLILRPFHIALPSPSLSINAPRAWPKKIRETCAMDWIMRCAMRRGIWSTTPTVAGSPKRCGTRWGRLILSNGSPVDGEKEQTGTHVVV